MSKINPSQTPAEVQSCHEVIAAFVHVTVLAWGLGCRGPGWDPLPLPPARCVDVCGDGHLLLGPSWAHGHLFSAHLRDENVLLRVLEPRGLAASLPGEEGSGRRIYVITGLVNDDDTRNNLATGFV